MLKQQKYTILNATNSFCFYFYIKIASLLPNFVQIHASEQTVFQFLNFGAPRYPPKKFYNIDHRDTRTSSN